ncbi:MAG: hypothetical protein V1742_08775 [Pseudomonadota bacterium]
MIYRLSDGRTVDTERELSFEERNFIQKMLIYKHLKMSLAEFRQRWREVANPVWKGPSILDNPTPAARIILDLEARIKKEIG